MPFYDREEKIINILFQRDTLKTTELAKQLYISLPTLRRDLIKLEQKGIIRRSHGTVSLKTNSADENIPLILRQQEHNTEKSDIAQKASAYIKNGYTIMLDGSTSACAIVPFLADFKNLIVITSSAKTSFILGEIGINNICTGGHMINKSLSYVGYDAERTTANYNADIMFFSCRGISSEGWITDNSIEENNLRQIMMKQSKKKILLCDSSKFNKTCLHNLCHIEELDDIISNAKIPDNLVNMLH